MNFCEGMAPGWADEIRHPDLETTEFWRRTGVVHSTDFNEDVAVALVQNGPGAEPQVSVGQVRFSLPEARTYVAAVSRALDLAVSKVVS